MNKKYIFVSYIKNDKSFNLTVDNFNQIIPIFLQDSINLNQISLSGNITFSDKYYALNYYSGSVLNLMDSATLLATEYSG